VLARGTVGRRLVAGIAAPAHAAFQQHDALPFICEIGENRFLVLGQDLRADRHFYHQVVRALAGAVLAHAVTAALRLEVLCVAKIDQGVEAGNRLEHDVPALAAVAAVRTAILDEFLSPEADRAGAAGAGLHVDLGLVEKMHNPFLKRQVLHSQPWLPDRYALPGSSSRARSGCGAQ
jgi:hypothetical protein